jgi:hypothetical protein
MVIPVTFSMFFSVVMGLPQDPIVPAGAIPSLTSFLKMPFSQVILKREPVFIRELKKFLEKSSLGCLLPIPKFLGP